MNTVLEFPVSKVCNAVSCGQSFLITGCKRENRLQTSQLCSQDSSALETSRRLFYTFTHNSWCITAVTTASCLNPRWAGSNSCYPYSRKHLEYGFPGNFILLCPNSKQIVRQIDSETQLSIVTPGHIDTQTHLRNTKSSKHLLIHIRMNQKLSITTPTL